MAGFGDAIKYLYRQFILRDVLSFVTPGAIIVLTAFLLFLPEPSLVQRLDKLFDLSRSIHWLLYIPLFGLFFMVGFAVQCFGEIIGLIRIHRIAQSCCCQRFKIFYCKWADTPSGIIWWGEAHKNVVAFTKYIHSDEWTQQQPERLIEWAEQQNERLVVLKQMCANGSLAIVIAGILILINLWCESPWCLLIVGVPLLASLFWGYRVHELRLDTMKKAIQGLPINGKQES